MTNRERGHRPLTPETDPERWEALVAAIVQDAAGELARRRRTRSGVLPVIEGWRRPVLSLSALLTAASITLLLVLEAEPPTGEEVTPTLIDAVAPATVAAWLSERYEPDALEIVSAFARSKP